MFFEAEGIKQRERGGGRLKPKAPCPPKKAAKSRKNCIIKGTASLNIDTRPCATALGGPGKV